MLKIVMLTAALSAASTTAFAFDVRETKVQSAVSTRGVDFGDPSAVQALHTQLVRKAAEVCDSGSPRMLSVVMSDRACAKQSLNRAVAQLNQPMLTAFHEGKPVVAPNTQLAQR